ncbi:MAG: hypothetical protein HY645_12965 [Acidobacteria bacterium]|nr:hypothetical protein [Acidobacteriota bacterium]
MELRKLLIVLVAIAVCGVSLLASSPPDGSGWTGLWRVEQRSDNSDAQVYHVLVKTGKAMPQVEVFNVDWVNLAIVKVTTQGNLLRFSSEMGGKPFNFELTQNGGAMSGKWSLVHPQYPLRGHLVGRRMLAQDQWKPFEGVNRVQSPEGLIDLYGYLIEKAPRGGSDVFTKFWEDEVEPKFYPLLHDLMYGRGTLQEGLRQEQLSRIYTGLNENKLEIARNHVREHYKSVHKELTLKLKTEMKSLTVVLPPMKRLTTDTRAVGGFFFTFLNLAEVQSYNPDQLRFLLAQQILLHPVLAHYPRETTLAQELFKQGILIYFSSLIGSERDRPNFLLMSPEEVEKTEESLAALKKEIRANVNNADAALMKRFFSTPPRPGRLVAYELIKSVSSRYTLAQMLDLQTPDVVKQVLLYLGSSQK